MGQRGSLCNLWTQWDAALIKPRSVLFPELFGEAPRDLRHLKGVRESIMKYVAFRRAGDLSHTS